MPVKFKVSGGVKNTLSSLSLNSSKRPLLRTIGLAMQEDAKETFEKEQDPVTGEAWKGLHPLTLASKSGGSKLVESGRLKRTVTQNQPRYTDNSVTIGTEVPYAKTHQFGATFRDVLIPKTPQARKSSRRGVYLKGGYIFARQVTVPMRRFLGFGTRTTKAVLDAAQSFLDGKFK
jgi:phage virion morphogenesis protein